MVTNDFFSEMRRVQAMNSPLVNVSEMVKQSDAKFPVVICDAWNENAKRQISQNEKGKLRDILPMLFFAIRGLPSTCNDPIKSAITGGDNDKSVFTVLLPTED